MNTHVSPTTESADKGFTLVEILIAIVLVGILSAVAVVGISNLVSKGSSSACSASLDASKAASAVYYASNSDYPGDFTDLTTGTTGIPAALTLPTGVTIDSTDLKIAKSGTSWTLTMTAGSGTTAPTFACTTP